MTPRPPQVARCLRTMSRLSPKELQRRYGLPTNEDARLLRQRAEDMVERGACSALQGTYVSCVVAGRCSRHIMMKCPTGSVRWLSLGSCPLWRPFLT